MPNALVHYFSGTGNSLLAAEQLSVELAKYGYTAVLHAVETGTYKDAGKFDLHIFFFPVYATSVPHIVRKYIRRLPDGRKAIAAVISTNGRISARFRDGYQGWALHQARLALYFKNYDVFFSDTLDYPHNVTNAFPPRKEKYNSAIIDQAAAKLPSIARKIARQEPFHRRFFLPNIIWSLPFGLLYSLFGRHFMGKLFAADSTCSACGLCVNKCPVQAIRISSGKVRWRWNCEGCLRCINICPKRAVQTSTLRLIALFLAIFANPLFLIFRLIPAEFLLKLGSFDSFVFYTLLDTFLIVLFLVSVDWLIFLFSGIPVFKDIIGWGHTQLFGRYTAGKYKDKFLNKKN